MRPRVVEADAIECRLNAGDLQPDHSRVGYVRRNQPTITTRAAWILAVEHIPTPPSESLTADSTLQSVPISSALLASEGVGAGSSIQWRSGIRIASRPAPSPRESMR
jgi:hypothetical protein